YGVLPFRKVMEPAIHYARHGHPLLSAASTQIAMHADFFRREWPTSARVWTPNGAVPEAGRLFCNPALADFWSLLLDEAETASSRIGQLEAARLAFYEGHAADAVDAYVRNACVMDGTGERRRGVISADDLAGWRATVEPAISIGYAGWTVWKPGPWTQGPSLLQSLRTADARKLLDIDHLGERFVHEVTEILKLSLADREAFYGDPEHSDIPLRELLSTDYAVDRAKLVSVSASYEFRPGSVSGLEPQASSFVRRVSELREASTGIGGGEPTMIHLENRDTDTVHVDVVDRWGNIVSATPSGGWLQSSPVVPGLGVPLNTRAQMFWLEPGLPSSLAPGRRPRTTLSPSMAVRPDGGRLAFGTPGGDQQDQWQLIFLLRLIHHGLNLQEAIDAPLFHTAHLQSSFYPREARPGHLLLESGFSGGVIKALRDRGHDLENSKPWSIGRLTAAEHGAGGVMAAAATPRLMQAYAIGR
ncbi:MAG: gamma-glutamyltransferase, partial [Albidovulum sp.]|nr:gamma-glutamyltransferase [Albidovulum sp.]